MTDTTAPTIWPTLRAKDALGLIRFLVDAFGLQEAEVVADGDVVAHAELRWPLGGGGIMLGSERTDPGDPWALSPGTAGIYVVTDGPDALFARTVAAGAIVVTEPHDTDYGSREFAVRDPEGNRWSFGTYRGAPLRS
jgi:uncharacterized glyoxalase superfamily protein PhnB